MSMSDRMYEQAVKRILEGDDQGTFESSSSSCESHGRIIATMEQSNDILRKHNGLLKEQIARLTAELATLRGPRS